MSSAATYYIFPRQAGLEAAKATTKGEESQQVPAPSESTGSYADYDDDGVTIHDAAMSGDTKLIERMLSHNADLVT